MPHYKSDAFDFEQYRPEVQAILIEELGLIREGKAHDALLMEGIAQDISVGQFKELTNWRSKNWRFMSALADAAIEIQGIGMLHFVTKVVGDNLVLQVTLKTCETLKRLHQVEKRYGGVKGASVAVDLARANATETMQIVIDNYWADIRRIGARRYD